MKNMENFSMSSLSITLVIIVIVASVAIYIYRKTQDKELSDELKEEILFQKEVRISEHASDRMIERLSVQPEAQFVLATNAFDFGKDSEHLQPGSDLRLEVEQIEENNPGDIVKLYSGNIFIYTEDKVLKTVYVSNFNKKN